MLAVPLHGVGRHGDDIVAAGAAPVMTQAPGRFQAIHLRHLHVHQHDVVRLALEGLQGFDAVGGHIRPVAQRSSTASASF